MTTRTTTPKVRVRAPGKVNLGLDVGRRRADGYHPLTTVFQAVSVYEDLTARPSRNFEITVSGRQADLVPLDDSNLAIKAARLLAEVGQVDGGVHLHIDKSIPVAGGMAGGSADAAAALVACDALWNTGLSREELHELAAKLGSDVPFALMGHTALGVGRGDQLSPVMVKGSYYWTFAVRDDGLSTPEVFNKFDERAERAEAGEQDRRTFVEAGESTGTTKSYELDESSETIESDLLVADGLDPALQNGIMTALRAGDAAMLGTYLQNDLQEAAFELDPDLRSIVELAQREGALGAIVSGSGPTVAILNRSAQSSLDMSVILSASRLVSDVIRAVGPVSGTKVVESVRGDLPDPSGRSDHPAGGNWQHARRPLGSV